MQFCIEMEYLHGYFQKSFKIRFIILESSPLYPSGKAAMSGVVTGKLLQSIGYKCPVMNKGRRNIWHVYPITERPMLVMYDLHVR